MSWRSHLRPASFRGVPFKVESTEVSGGRRKDVSEFPQRDEPSVRDMGRKAREYPVTGFVIGDDYMTWRDALQAALEERGSGELIHPYYGSIAVDLTFYRIREEWREGGVARFDFSFIESGTQAFPITSVSTADLLISAAQCVLNFLNSVFAGRYSLKNLPNWARDVAGADLCNIFDSAQTLVRQADSSGNWLASFNGERTKAASSINNSATLATYTQNALTPTASVAASLSGSGNALGSITRWAASGLAVSSSASTNTAALAALVRGSLLSEGATLIADTDVAVYDDAIAARNTMISAIDAELLTTTDDDLYQAWSDLRSALYQDLTTRARDASRLKSVTPRETTSALALAYDLYEAGGRDLEIVTRNAISNPNFVPAEAIKVLSA